MVTEMDDRDRMKTLLIDAISTLCRNGLKYKEEITVDGLIGITLDKQDVFLVKVHETFALSKESSETSGSAGEQSTTRPSGKKRGVKRPSPDFDDESLDENSELATHGTKYRKKDGLSRRGYLGKDSQSTSPKQGGDFIVIDDPDELGIKTEAKSERLEACMHADSETNEHFSKSRTHSFHNQPNLSHSRFGKDDCQSTPVGFEPGQIQIFAQEVKEELSSDSDLAVFTNPGEMVRMPSTSSQITSQSNPLTMAVTGPAVFPGVPVSSDADWSSPSASQEFIPMPDDNTLPSPSQMGSNISNASQQVPGTGENVDPIHMAAVIEVDTPEGKKFLCPYCKHKNQYYTSKFAAKRHVISRHTDCDYRCPFCGNVYQRRDLLSRHVRSTHALTDAQTPTDVPDASFLASKQ